MVNHNARDGDVVVLGGESAVSIALQTMNLSRARKSRIELIPRLEIFRNPPLL
jgi:hypothetical protein